MQIEIPILTLGVRGSSPGMFHKPLGVRVGLFIKAMYAKIFTQILDSTIADDYQVRHVFSDLLILADCSGAVNMTVESIARRTNVPIKIIERAIKILESPDRRSRTPDHEGRRLIRLDDRKWGWQIVNFLKYRSIASEEQRRESQRNRTAKFRALGGGNYEKWPATRARVLKRDQNTCQYCGNPADCVDHVIPLSKGGSGSDDNLAASCTPCNNRKNNRTPHDAGMILKFHPVTPSNMIPPSNAMQRQKQMHKQKEGERENPPSNGILGTAERIELGRSLERISKRLVELKDADLGRAPEERRELKAEKTRILGLLGLKA